ncbi:hypothetical protein [Amycolatopsis australiensis]|uniref:Uncharacterized protein n=1 Tax=Amycolatopsis australiensis TaxID=546364 RepID=A0A1K1RV78_9PSEU|nr:hypothetical protein [Amycolatopsis australiensis]SFW75990.1 hypothetical protein SAMN04489730_4027 [Amycolatopsis australiensis]
MGFRLWHANFRAIGGTGCADQVIRRWPVRGQFRRDSARPWPFPVPRLIDDFPVDGIGEDGLLDTTHAPIGPADVAGVRRLARDGRLAVAASTAPPGELARLRGAVYAVAWPLVFARITRPLERRRRHPDCVRGLEWLRPDCLDRFHDDVEAVVEHALHRASGPIGNFDGWLASRLGPATVDAHRRRRGETGALQRPRLPAWLAGELGGDPWLCDLAVQVLVWAGVPSTAGARLWPLDAWAARRAEVTGEPPPGRDTLDREVRTVLTAMRTRPKWHAEHVERPLGHKRPPVAPMPADSSAEPAPLPLVDPAEADDIRLAELADRALRAIEARLERGEAPPAAVAAVVRRVFGAGGGVLDRLPHEGATREDWLAAALADEARVDRIVAAVLAILGR